MRNIAVALVGAVLAAGAVPASAAVVLCSGANCAPTDENVLIRSVVNGVVTGTTNQSQVGVTFTSGTDVLTANANGQASVGAADGLLNSLTFTLQQGFGFTSAVFNLSPLPGNRPNEATSVFITYFTPQLGQQTRTISTNGNNFIGISATNGEIFTGAGFVANPGSTGIDSFQQLRLGGVQSLTAAVPEPSTWAMMLLGMFGIGASLRSSRRRTRARIAFA
ncbi:PEP-CTERM sorting domain-containing protein [Erythrobacteraceae bacterium CFH 75059]|uniref:PEPxxWA-CTERM sorting domain-containing protein n=1 Tax=Qipengyuania thermophila TaxID=2509361 RepID=UPI001020F542|nr:PEPxxWA-CTERM sorting domain-containing protein [Qipengyuania thermophila]TCD06344.1 PEP-CTERM sorting domain-containing protein [Erythrobacteraceae bacterium CFH 75059]